MKFENDFTGQWKNPQLSDQTLLLHITGVPNSRFWQLS
jgi:hypothetical protein